MSDVTDLIQEVIDKLSSLTTHYGPHLLSLVERSVYVNCLASIIWGFILLFVFVLMVIFFVILIIKWDTVYKRDIEILIVVPIIGGVLSLIPTCLLLGDIWNWVGITDPELYMAHQIINKVTGQ